MEKSYLPSIEVKYVGKDADNGLVDGVSFGKSLEGTSKLYNQIIYVFETGNVPAGRSKYNTQIYASAPEKGCLFLGLESLIIAGNMAVYPKLWHDIAEWFIPNFLKALWYKIINKPDKTIEMYEFMQKELSETREFSKEMANMAISSVMESQDRFLDTINRMAANNKQNSINMVAPIGVSCDKMNHKILSGTPLKIDEAQADVVRSKEELEITDMSKYTCKIDAVDRTTGHCRIITDEGIFSGKITDPALESYGDIYTDALNTGLDIIINAKTTLKNDVIQKFFISDAVKA